MLTSIIPDASEVLRQLINSIKNGDTPREAQGAMALASYHDSGRFVPLSLQSTMLDLKQGLESGKILTNVPREAPK
jgi:hypothetical protein